MPTPIADTWTLDASGAWNDGSYWSSGVPLSADDVIVSPTGSAQFVVTYAQSGTINSLSGGSTATLDIASGLLALASVTNVGGATVAWAGAVSLTAGAVLDVQNGWTIGGVTTLSSGATVEVDAGTLVLNGGGVLEGVVDGAGTVVLGAGTFSVPDLTLTSPLDLTAASTLDLAGNYLIFTGNAGLSGTIVGTSASRLYLEGTATISGLTTTGAPDVLVGYANSTGTVTQTGTFTATGSVDIAKGSLYDLAGDVGLTDGGGLATTVDGLLEKTAGTATSTIAGNFSETFNGTLDIATGTIALTGGKVVLDGALQGTGTLLSENASQVTLDNFAMTLALNQATLAIADQNVANTIDLFAITLAVNDVLDVSAVSSSTTIDGFAQTGTNYTTLDLNGSGAFDGTAGGSVLFTTLAGFTIAAGGRYEMAGVDLAGGVTLDSSGTIDADGGITLDSDGAAATSLLINEATATFLLAAGGAAIAQGGAADTISNAGLMEKLSGAGAASIAAASFVNTGTVLVAAGTLSISSAVSGAGTLALGTDTSLLLGGGFAGTALFGGTGATLGLGAPAAVTGTVAGFAMGDTIDLTGAANATATLAVLNAATASLSLNGSSVLLTGDFVHMAAAAQADGNGGTDVTLVNAAFGSLPVVDSFFTAAVATELDAAIAALVPGSGLVNVPTVAGGGSVYSIAGALNAMVVSAPGAGGGATLPGGYRAGYLLAGSAALTDTAGSGVLIATAAGDSLTGAAADTLFGGNAGTVLTATTGAETLIGGTGANSFFLGSSTALVTSHGNDTITGSSGAETVNASGSVLYFGTSGATDFTATGSGGDTLIGGATGNTITGGGGSQLIFGSSTLTYAGGAGAATLIGGGGGNTVTGGSGNLLVFASSSLTFAGTGGAATLIGGGGAVNAYLGAGGGVVYGSPDGNDTLASGSGLSILVGGGSGDLLVATGAANDTLIAGAGAETLYGAGSSGNLVLFGGPGNDVLVGGSGRNLFVAEPGNETLVGGGGGNDIIFTALAGTSRTDVISGFNPATDAVGLFGYGAEPGADAAALASTTSSGGNTIVSLSDGTTLVFTGAPTLTANNFF
jgi:hypothetical protein